MTKSNASLRWSTEDRLVFLNACEKLGTTDWSKVATEVKSKSKKQCRDRLRKLLLREIQTRMGRRKAQMKRKLEVTKAEREVYNRVLKNHCRDHGHEVARIIVLIYRDPKGRGKPTPEQAMNVASSLGILDFSLEELENEIRQGERIATDDEKKENKSVNPIDTQSSVQPEVGSFSLKRKPEIPLQESQTENKKIKENSFATPSKRGSRRSNVVSPDNIASPPPLQMRSIDILSPAEKEHFEFHLKLQSDISIAQSVVSTEAYNFKAEKNPRQIYVNHLNHTERQAVSAMMSLCSGL